MDSPFNSSSRTIRTPPPERHDERDAPAPPVPSASSSSLPPAAVEAASTAEIQKWLSSIEQCLGDICTISSEGKLNSDQKLKISNISRNIIGGISQMAVQYQSLKQKYISSLNMIKTLTDQNDISDQLRDLKQYLKSAPKPSEPNQSYAAVVKTSANIPILPSSTSSLAIYPTEKDKTSEDTKKLVQNIIKPDELKLHVRALRKTKNGGVIISTDRKDDLEKLKKSQLLKTSGLKLEETAKRKPRIILLGVPSNITDKEVFECLYEQNIVDNHPSTTRDTFLNSVKLSHKSGKKEAPTCNFIVEVTADLRRALIQQQRVFINWTSCPVRDFTLLTRCYKCQQYGHSAKYCRDTDPTCGHCGGVGHSIKECPKRSEEAKCATCLRFKKSSNHKTGDDLCPAKRNAEARQISFIDYEGA